MSDIRKEDHGRRHHSRDHERDDGRRRGEPSSEETPPVAIIPTVVDEDGKFVFLTKRQRGALAVKRKEEDVARQLEHSQASSRKRQDFLLQDEAEREKERRERQKQREAARKKAAEEERVRLEKQRLERESRNSGRNEKTPSAKSSLADLDMLSLPEKEQRERQALKELEQIRSHYLGMKREKKKIQKPSEKFRNIFNFEWDVNEDTALNDNNPLYQQRVEPQLLFGRGFRAGIDIREQRKHNNFYDQLARKRVEAGGELSDIIAKVTPSFKARDIDELDESSKHWTEKPQTEMTERDWRIFKEDFEIYTKGVRVPPPMRTWAEADLPWELLKAVREVGYERPTSIQMQAIPVALQQRDLIGIAETGSGKTAAFMLPLLTYIKALPPLDDESSQDGPYGLVLAPSRELAIQIDEEARKFASFCKCRTVAVVGGRNAEAQAFELRRGVELVIGTPGRVMDCLEKAYTVLNQCNYVVLDEADRMIDLGFEEVVNSILDRIPASNLKSLDEDEILRQELEAKAGHRRYRLTQMFSATMPPAVESLARKYMRSPVWVSIGDPGAGKRAIEQVLEFMAEGKKKQRLQEILELAEPPIMVFVNQKKVADVLAKSLQKLGFRAQSLHGGKTQDNREASLTGFKEGETDVLVATDVAGRGIDVEGVQLVVNFDMPKDIETYTHRIGRTGRAGKKGCALSFVTEEDSGLYYDLKNLLTSTNNLVPLDLSQHPMSKVKPGTVPQQGPRLIIK